MKIELESFNVSIVEDGEDFIARIRFNRADDRLIVGDSGTGLMNEVIEVVQAHMFASGVLVTDASRMCHPGAFGAVEETRKGP